MVLSDSIVTEFVDLCVRSLEVEDHELRSAFESYSSQGLYRKCHHGIWNVLEGHKLHTIYRALLKARFPLEVEWESPRPTGGLADFAIRDTEKVLGVVEAKDFDPPFSGKSRLELLREDIREMNEGWPGRDVRKFCLVFWHVHSSAQVETEAVEFERQLPVRLNSAWQRSFPTLRYSSAEGRQRDALTCVTLLEVIEG